MQKDRSPKEKIKRALHLKRAIGFVWRSAPGWTVAGVFLIILQSLLPLALLYLMKLVVDSVTAGLDSPDKAEAFKQVAFYIVIAGGVTLLTALCRSVASLIKVQQSQLVADNMNSIIHAKSVEVDLEYYESSKYYDKLHRAQREGPHRPNAIVNGLIQTAQNIISLLVMAGLLFSFHWAVTIVLFAGVLPGIFVQLKFADTMYLWSRRRTPIDRQASYLNSILTRDVFAKEVRLFSLGSLLINRFRDLRRRLREERLHIATKRSIADASAQACSAAAVLGAYAFIAYRTVNGDITLGDMVMYYQAFQRGLQNLKQLLGGLAGLYENNLFLANLHEFLDLKSKVAEPAHPRRVPKPLQRGIAFEHISFQYPTGNREVLSDVSFSIGNGEAVALVGENGSGKTTLIKLLCRLYDPNSGVITVDGIDLRQFAVRDLRREISVIFQDYARYNLSARENIWFGNLDVPADDSRIAHAAQYAGADGIISGLPRGYDTILGKLFENGEELSIGEWQKVALARAFLRDSQVIVLDEPTSSLDAKAEYEVFNRFRELAKGRTAILISHRFSTVRMADRIIMLEGGRIIEDGSHSELVHYGGKYAHLFEKQAQFYK